MKSRLIALLCAGFVTAVALGQAGAQNRHRHILRKGESFPPFSANDVLTGANISLNQYRGKVVLLEYWLPTVPICMGDRKLLRDLHKEHKDEGFEIISVCCELNVKRVKEFLEREKFPWPQVCDGGGYNSPLVDRFAVELVPMMFVIGRDGKLVSDQMGEQALLARFEKFVVDALKVKYVGDQDELDVAAAKQLAEADALRDKGDYAAALEGYEKIGVTYAGREVAQTANRRARDLREDPEVMKKVEEQLRNRKPAPKENAEAARQGEQWLKVARQMTARKDYTTARKYYQRVIDTYPGTAQAEVAKSELARLPKS